MFTNRWMNKENKSDRERQILYDILYMWNLKNTTNLWMKPKSSRLTDIEHKLVVTSSKRKGGEGQYRGRRVQRNEKTKQIVPREPRKEYTFNKRLICFGDRQGGLVCCNSWGRKELNMTERLNWTELIQFHKLFVT